MLSTDKLGSACRDGFGGSIGTPKRRRCIRTAFSTQGALSAGAPFVQERCLSLSLKQLKAGFGGYERPNGPCWYEIRGEIFELTVRIRAR